MSKDPPEGFLVNNFPSDHMQNQYFVYILTNKSNDVLYVGVTNDVVRRVAEHKSHSIKGFTQKYMVDKCVYVEVVGDVNAAIAREKQIKGWSRKRKFDLINSQNPNFDDLYCS